MTACNDPRHDEIESWYRQALAVSQDRPGLLPDTTAEGLLRLLARAYMRGHSHGRNSNAPPNPKAAVEALLTEVVEYHTEEFGPSPDTRHLMEGAAPRAKSDRDVALSVIEENRRLRAAPRSEGLDVERLRQAIDVAFPERWMIDAAIARDGLADKIADAYRLSRPSDEREGDPR